MYVRLLGKFSVEVGGRAVVAPGGGCVRPARWWRCWRWPPAADAPRAGDRAAVARRRRPLGCPQPAPGVVRRPARARRGRGSRPPDDQQRRWCSAPTAASGWTPSSSRRRLGTPSPRTSPPAARGPRPVRRRPAHRPRVRRLDHREARGGARDSARGRHPARGTADVDGPRWTRRGPCSRGCSPRTRCTRVRCVPR